MLNAKGACHLRVNHQFTVHIEEGDADNYFFYAHLGSLPDRGNEAVFGEILKANLYGKRTQNCVFALDDHGTEVILFRQNALSSVDFASYFQTFQDFVSQVAYWRQELQRLGVQIENK